MNPVIMRMVVDFPAPLGPRNPKTSPLSTVNETPLTAIFDPNAFTRFSTLIIQISSMRLSVRFIPFHPTPLLESYSLTQNAVDTLFNTIPVK